METTTINLEEQEKARPRQAGLVRKFWRRYLSIANLFMFKFTNKQAGEVGTYRNADGLTADPDSMSADAAGIGRGLYISTPTYDYSCRQGYTCGPGYNGPA